MLPANHLSTAGPDPAGPGATRGLVRFIRYAFMPNHLGYCGGAGDQLLLEQAVAGQVDRATLPLLARFSGAVPYLRVIAGANGLAEPFDERVVEAYWLGNSLLERVEAADLYRTLEERFGRQLTGRVRQQVLDKPPQGAKPHHLFHVLDVYRHLEVAEVGMAAMESCRVSWGQVTRIEGPSLTVSRQPLELAGTRLALGPPRPEPVLRSLSGRGFVDQVRVGDWVSLHWGWVCEVLDHRRLSSLRRWTAHHLDLANRTI